MSIAINPVKSNIVNSQYRIQKTSSAPITFKGSVAQSKPLLDVIATPFEFLFTKLAVNEKVQNWLIKNTANGTANKLKTHIGALEGAWVSGFYIFNTLTNKKIPDERKKPLVLNSVICGAVGLVGSYTLCNKLVDFAYAVSNKLIKNGYINKLEGGVDALRKQGKAIPFSQYKLEHILKDGCKDLALLAIITVMFRYVAPVIATPLSTKINDFCLKHDLYNKTKSFFGIENHDKKDDKKIQSS